MHLITRAWLRLLLPHLAPGYELYDEAARQYLGRATDVAPGDVPGPGR